MYKDFMEGLDADDNGIEIADVVRYKQGTSLPVRVGRLNQRWNDDTTGNGNGPSEDERFAQASGLCGTEFSEALEYIVNCQLPARKVVEEALQTRTQVHSSGEVIRFTNGGCPWKTRLYELERSDKDIKTVAQIIHHDILSTSQECRISRYYLFRSGYSCFERESWWIICAFPSRLFTTSISVVEYKYSAVVT